MMWDSLETVKLLISVLNPVIILVIGYIINKSLKNYEKVLSVNARVREKRIEIFDRTVPKLNDILCFHCYIGNWKDLTPEYIIKLKRELDKEIHIYAPLFTENLCLRYNDFMNDCFRTYAEAGADAKIKSLFYRRKEASVLWNPEVESLFCEKYQEICRELPNESAFIDEKKEKV